MSIKYTWVFLCGAVVGFSINSVFFDVSAPLKHSPVIMSNDTNVYPDLNQDDSQLIRVKQYIDHQQVDLAINELSSRHFNDAQSGVLMQYLKSHLMNLVNNKNWLILDEWLRAIELAGLADSDSYGLQAHRFIIKGQYHKALEAFFVAKDMATSQQEQGKIVANIQSAINQMINAFNQGSLVLSSDEIEQLFSYAQQQLQEYIPISLVLAQVYRQQGELQKALDALAFLPYDEQFTKQVTDMQISLESALAEAELNKEGIPLIRSGSQFLVEVQIGKIDLVLLIDTGASYTSLSQSAIARLSDETNVLSGELKKIKVNTANGTTVARVFSVSSFMLAKRQAQDLSVLEVNMGEHTRSDGLLGMNFLGQYHFNIDQGNALLFLEKK